MLKLFLLFITVLAGMGTLAQNGFLVVKKRNKPARYFGKDSRITFQTGNDQWISGNIDKIEKDSFTVTQQIIHYYTIGTDTIYYKGLRFALADISALPPGNDEHFLWLRSGLLFQLAGGGYACLNIINDLYRKEPPFVKKKLTGLGIAGAAFLFGTILHLRFDPYIRAGKKYTFELVPF